MTSDVWCLMLYVMLYNCYHMSDVWFYMVCHITVVRRLMYNIRLLITVIWCRRSDNSYMTADVWCYMLCYISVIRRLMSNIRRLMTVVWGQTSDNCYICADVWYQLYDRGRPLSCNCYHTSDVWFCLLCYITVIRRLITVIWQQMSAVI